MENYDPNITWNDSVVRVTLQQWEYTGTFDMPTGGNVKGASLLGMALDPDTVFENLDSDVITNNECELKMIGEDDETGDEWFSCVLKNKAGDTLECEDDVDDFANYIVGVELISFEKHKTHFGEMVEDETVDLREEDEF
jgi:hypothetical protein